MKDSFGMSVVVVVLLIAGFAVFIFGALTVYQAYRMHHPTRGGIGAKVPASALRPKSPTFADMKVGDRIGSCTTPLIHDGRAYFAPDFTVCPCKESQDSRCIVWEMTSRGMVVHLNGNVLDGNREQERLWSWMSPVKEIYP